MRAWYGAAAPAPIDTVAAAAAGPHNRPQRQPPHAAASPSKPRRLKPAAPAVKRGARAAADTTDAPMTSSARVAPRHRPVRRLALAGVLACAAAGCAVQGGHRTGAGATAVDAAHPLPLADAGVRDRRAVFGELMQQALDDTSGNGSPDGMGTGRSATTVLLLPAAGPSSATGNATAIRRHARARLARTVVLIVPGLFSDCVASQSLPFGDGVARASAQVSYTQAYTAIASDLPGLEIKALAVHGRASAAWNGRIVASALRAEAHRPDVERIVVVAYSKGMTDTLHALDDLARSGAVPAKLMAVVSVAGVVRGTPLADEFGGLYDLAPSGVAPLDCPPSLGGEVDSLTRERRIDWLQRHALPGSLRYYSIVALAEPDTVSLGLRAFHATLRGIDPVNDGQVIGADALLPRSDLLAVARSDHWTFVLPLEGHPSAWVRGLSSQRPWPRDALLRAIVWYVLGSTGDTGQPAPPLAASPARPGALPSAAAR